jgi:putative oxidoreductase
MQGDAPRPKSLDTFRPQIFALTRIVFGLLYAMHGLRLVFGLFGDRPSDMPEAAAPFIGGMLVVSGVLVAIGYKTRFVAFFCSGQMAVAYFGVHQKDGLFPIENHGELAALYSWAFLMIASVRDWVWAIEPGSVSARVASETESQ